MKIITLGLFLLTNIILLAQKPEKVYSIVMERRDSSWYVTQENLWKKEIDKNINNAEAWYYYYEAVRAQSHFTPWESEEREKFHQKMEQITKDLYENNPNSFEANYLMYRNFGTLGKRDGYFEYLEKAYEIDPLDGRSYDLFMVHYEIHRDKKKFKEFCVKFYNANEIAGFIYNWAYNLLMGLDENAILFTGGDNDTFSCWALQSAAGIRPDVTVLNTSLLNLDDYRIKVFDELGIKQFEKRLDSSKTNEEYFERWDQLYTHFFQNKKGYPVYVSTTCMQQFSESFEDSLYLTGLAYKYAPESFDNMATIRRNYEKTYKMDYMDQIFGFHIQNGKLWGLNGTYLPCFVKLYKHYKACGEDGKANELELKIKNIATETDQLEEVEKMLAE